MKTSPMQWLIIVMHIVNLIAQSSALLQSLQIIQKLNYQKHQEIHHK